MLSEMEAKVEDVNRPGADMALDLMHLRLAHRLHTACTFIHVALPHIRGGGLDDLNGMLKYFISNGCVNLLKLYHWEFVALGVWTCTSVSDEADYA